MNAVVLANIEYRKSSSSAANELQEGLRFAGWQLCGEGYDDLTDLREILAKYKPQAIFFQDELQGFTNLTAISIPVFGTTGYGSLNPKALVGYYRSEDCDIRIYHSVNAVIAQDILQDFKLRRRDCVVSGRRDKTLYPIRELAFQKAESLGIDTMDRSDPNSSTAAYLRKLSDYKTHVATAGKHGCAVRKIIESVAMGVTPITDLPASDVLPMIDHALVRIPAGANERTLQAAITEAVTDWDFEERMIFAAQARMYYDYRVLGLRLSEALLNLIPNLQLKVSMPIVNAPSRKSFLGSVQRAQQKQARPR